MKKLITFFILIIAGISIWGFSFTETNPEEEQLLLTVVGRMLNENHYHRVQINDDFSEKIYDLYVNRMDYNKMYFLEEDIKRFSAFKTRLDDDLLKADLTFYRDVKSTFEKRMKEAEVLCEEVMKEDFDFKKKDAYESDPEKRDYAKSRSELKSIWKQYLKYSVVNSYLTKLENQQMALEKGADSAGSEFEKKSEKELLKESVEAVAKNMKTRFDRRSEVDDEDNFAVYVNAIASAFGPHTQYFPPQEKENFDMRMTGRLEGIGAVLQEADGFIKINSIVTGSACWRQGELEVGDLILKVAQGDDEPEDIVDAPMKEVLKLIRGPKGTEVRLTVQKKDGEIRVIPIVRDVVIREETYAKSAVIEDQVSKRKYGYVYLPGFYSKFGQTEGRSSAEDVDKELEKLKEQRVEGIILDLRNNGGGSLPDAVDLAGLFIKDGPIVQVKDTRDMIYVKSDHNSQVTYSGPLIIMINTFSASASEIVSGALKDYGRAIIVGSPSTYGKGTVQTFTDLNNALPQGYVLSAPFGSLKFTVQQFYRINGSSTQFKGVHADIMLPDFYDVKDVGESSLEHSLPWDSVPTLSYARWSQQPSNLSQLQSASDMRRGSQEKFKVISDRISQLREEKDETEISLYYDDVVAKREERKDWNDRYDALKTVNENLTIKSMQELEFKSDTAGVARITNWEEQLSKDFYLHETLNIMNDLLTARTVPSVADEDKPKDMQH